MKLKVLASSIAACFLFSAAVQADDTNCPVAAQQDMNARFGLTSSGQPTSAITQCLSVRKKIKVVVNVSNKEINAAKNISQQINNVQNMVSNYETMYGIAAGEDGYQIAVIAHGAGGRFLLNDDAHLRTYGTVNTTKAAMEALINKGVNVIMCQNTMKANNWVSADLLPGVTEVPAGVTGVTDYGMQGWVVLTP